MIDHSDASRIHPAAHREDRLATLSFWFQLIGLQEPRSAKSTKRTKKVKWCKKLYIYIFFFVKQSKKETEWWPWPSSWSRVVFGGSMELRGGGQHRRLTWQAAAAAAGGVGWDCCFQSQLLCSTPGPQPEKRHKPQQN